MALEKKYQYEGFSSAEKLTCRQCGSLRLFFYDGMLGYESIKCRDCGHDQNDEPRPQPRSYYPDLKFMVHVRLADDGSLPKELWEEAEAPTKIDAIKCVLERPEHLGERPEIVYVSEGEFRWPDGTPGCVERFRMIWGGTK